MALPITWLFRPPGDLLGGVEARIRIRPFPLRPLRRVALLPAFQPLGMRGGGGDGADPDAFVYPGDVPTLNEYFPSYPVDMALARYEQSGDVTALRALGVGADRATAWLVSRMRGGIGLAAASLAPELRCTAASASALSRRC